MTGAARPPQGDGTAVTWQACVTCGATRPETDPATRCACGGLLEVRHRPPPSFSPPLGSALDWRPRFDARGVPRVGLAASGVWRYRELVLPSVRDCDVVTAPEGNTPLLVRPPAARWAGLHGLLFKHEGQNPTGSFKDRGMTVGVTQARRLGAAAVACASTGNTAASLAAYAGLAGLPALVLLPAGQVALGKMAQTLASGARVLAVRGDFDDCLRVLEQAAEPLGLYLLNSINPFRLEGQKTIVFELLDQLGWDPPDWIVLPAGNLGNTAAFGKALSEARQCGLIGRVPRLAAIQAAGAAPFAAGYREGFQTRHRVRPETVATAIRIGAPASWDRAVTAIRETDGVVTTVSDSEILEAQAVLNRCGAGCEPASAASLAGVRRLVVEGTISTDARVVAVLTGHLLKDPDTAAAAGEVVEITARVEEVARATTRAGRGPGAA